MDYPINSFAQPLYVLFYYSLQLSIWMYRIIWMNEKNRHFHQIREKKQKKSFKKKKKRKARELLIYYIKFCRKSGVFLRFFPGEGPPPPSESWSSFECSACVGKQRKRERRAGRQTRQDWACMREPSSKFLFFFRQHSDFPPILWNVTRKLSMNIFWGWFV